MRPQYGESHKRRKGRLNNLACYGDLKLPARRSVWLLSIVPAFIFSCSEVSESLLPRKQTQIYITKAEKTTSEALDLFFFDAGEPYVLDAYQRFEGISSGCVSGSSTCGNRLVAAICNHASGRFDWSGILSFRNLSATTVNLADEDPASPVMSGTGTVRAGTEPSCTISLTPLLCKIEVRSLRCDFSSRPYHGEPLRNVKIYLTHVKASSGLFGPKDDGTWINDGGLSEADLEPFRHPEMVFMPLQGIIGEREVRPDVTLFAYANPTEEEDLANRHTRLVIEGSLKGTTYYYPLEIPPLERGSRHIYDLVITRSGTRDPELLADSGMIQVLASIAPWNEMDSLTEQY